MNVNISIFLDTLAGIIFLGAAALLLIPRRWKLRLREWSGIAAGFVVLSGMAFMRVYQLAGGDQPSFALEWLGSMLLVLGAAAAGVGVFLSGKKLTRDELDRAAVERSLNLFQQTFRHEPHLLAVKDRDGLYQAVNPAYAAFLGRTEKDLAGESDHSFFPRPQAVTIRQEEEQVLASGMERMREEEWHGASGSHWFRVTRLPVRAENNEVTGILVTAEEITTEKMAEATIAGWETRVAQLVDAEVVLGDLNDQPGAWGELLGAAVRLANAQHGALWQMQPEQTVATFRVGMGRLQKIPVVQVRVRDDLLWKVWQTSQTVVVENYQNWPGCGQFGRETGFGAAVGLPLKINGKIGWVITLFYDQPVALPSEQVQPLELFARMASSVLRYGECQADLKAEMLERQKALDNLQYRTRLEHLVASMAVRFINLDAARVDEAITRSLQTLAHATGVDRCYLALFPRGGTSQAAAGTDWYTSVESGDEIRRDHTSPDFHWYLARLNQAELIHVPRWSALAAEADGAAAYLADRGIRSFTAIPLMSSREAVGYLAFEARKVEIEWTGEILTLLRVSAEMFVGLLDRKRSACQAQELQEKSGREILALKQENQEGQLISEMGDLLQACRTADEAYPILTRYIQRLVQAGAGALYLIHDSKDPAENVIAWGKAQSDPIERELVLNECWGMRRGRLYSVHDPASEPLCGHITTSLHSGYMCVPLIAQGVGVGVLHLRRSAEEGYRGYSIEQERLAVKIAEYLAMALTNIRLRDELRSQAIRDPLTGLFNRRYMEETLDREIRRANRHHTCVGTIMFDIDRMKPINDRFGHDAGDLLLRGIGREMLHMFRGEDVACRYGGDEFTIVLPEATVAEAWTRAEQLREALRSMNLQYEGQSLGPVTISIGVAAYPDHAERGDRLLMATDAASYAAKSEGGNRIMMAHKMEG